MGKQEVLETCKMLTLLKILIKAFSRQYALL